MKRKEKLELITLTLLNWFFFLDFSHFKNDPDRLLFIVGTGIKLENLWYRFDNSLNKFDNLSEMFEKLLDRFDLSLCSETLRL